MNEELESNWSRACLRVFGGEGQAIALAERLLGPSQLLADSRVAALRQGRGLWLRDSKVSKAASLSEHIDALVKYVAENEAAVTQISKDFSVQMFCGIGSSSGTGSIAVNAAALATLGRAGVALIVDIHCS